MLRTDGLAAVEARYAVDFLRIKVRDQVSDYLRELLSGAERENPW